MCFLPTIQTFIHFQVVLSAGSAILNLKNFFRVAPPPNTLMKGHHQFQFILLEVLADNVKNPCFELVK